jgi:radical SAM superfamily enzyme YgiQ (UPF0313 family)
MVRVLDAKNDVVTDDVLRRHLLEFQPEIFGVTAMTREVHAAAEACTIVKRVSPDIWTVIGGPHTSALPERTLEEFSSVDITVAGEGEITITELAEAKASGAVPSELENILDIAFRVGDRVFRTGKRPWLKNLDDLPFPAWELFPKVSRGSCPVGVARSAAYSAKNRSEDKCDFAALTTFWPNSMRSRNEANARSGFRMTRLA